MKIICDVHISYKIVRFFQTKGVEAHHVNTLPDKWYTKDSFISQYADANELVLISKDSDFKDSHFVNSSPKKLIKISLGNIPNGKLIEIFETHFNLIEQVFNADIGFIEINESHLNIIQK